MVIKSSTSVIKFDKDTDSSSHATLVTIYWRNNFFQSISDYYILVQWIILFQLNTVLRKFDVTASKGTSAQYSSLCFNFTITNPFLFTVLDNTLVTSILSTGILQIVPVIFSVCHTT